MPGDEVSRALSPGNTTPAAHELSTHLPTPVRLAVWGAWLSVVRMLTHSMTRLQLASLKLLLLQHQLVRTLEELRSFLKPSQKVRLRARCACRRSPVGTGAASGWKGFRTSECSDIRAAQSLFDMRPLDIWLL
jgi:hypothetical protein